MDYLCVAMQREAAEKQNFDSRESAEAFFGKGSEGGERKAGGE